jgi:viroplasmin and RNaseH domain-containing protein
MKVLPFTQKNKQYILAPKRETLEIEGKLFYSEGSQAWNIIRLKKDLLYNFPQLKEKRSNFSYKMIMPHSLEELKSMIKNLESNSPNIPILLFFCKEDNNE